MAGVRHHEDGPRARGDGPGVRRHWRGPECRPPGRGRDRRQRQLPSSLAGPAADIGVTNATIYRWCEDLGIDINEYRCPVEGTSRG